MGIDSQNGIAGVLAAQDIVQTLAQLKQRNLVEDAGNRVFSSRGDLPLVRERD